MPATTPADLTVAFRSFSRRQREAIGDANPATLGGLLADLQGHIAAAAAALRTSPDAEAVAHAIESRHPDDWDDATLATLRAEALEAGSALRRLAAAAGAEDD
jgi:hypothetical protein